MMQFRSAYAQWVMTIVVGVLSPVTWCTAAGQDVHEQLVRQEAAGWGRNMPALLGAFSDDVVYEDPAIGVVFRGKEQIQGFAQSFFNAFPDLKAELKFVVVSGNRGASEWRFTGTQAQDLPGFPSAGRRMDMHGASIYEFENGKIKRKTDYWDLNGLRQQLSPAENGR